MWRYRAQERSTPVKREAVIAGLASEGLALIRTARYKFVSVENTSLSEECVIYSLPFEWTAPPHSPRAFFFFVVLSNCLFF